MKKLLISGVLSTILVGSLFAGEVVATVNGQDVTKEEVNAFLKPLAGGATLDVVPAQAQTKVIEQVIEKKLLAEYAMKEGTTKSKEYIDALEKIKADLALEIWMGEEFKKVKITDDDAKKFYKDNKEDKFKEEETVKARHILVKTEDEAKALIKEVNEAKDKKAKFIELAQSKSTGPSGANGGDLGFFTKKQMVPEFSEAAFSQKAGSVSEKPVKTQFGFHIIFVEEKKAAGYMDYEKVADQVKNFLKMDKFKDSTEAKAKELREKAKVEIKIQPKVEAKPEVKTEDKPEAK